MPGGEHVTIGGAIAANVIGKDSNKLFASFGDNIEYIKIISYNGKVRKLKKSVKNFYKYIGSFGMFGIILEAEIKIFKLEKINYNLNHYQINSKKEFNALDKNTKVFYVI
mgnify:CR=1 FL=1